MINIGKIVREVTPETLWSNVIGRCVLEEVDEDDSITVNYRSYGAVFSKYGEFIPSSNMCNIFPSETMQDWNKFAWKKGDVLSDKCGFTLVFKKWSSDDYTKFDGCYSNSRDGYENVYNADTMKFEKLDNNSAAEYINEIERNMNGKLDLSTLRLKKTDDMLLIPRNNDFSMR